MEITRDQLEIMKYEAIKKSPYKLELFDVIWERATLDSAQYIEPFLDKALLFRKKEELWDYTISQIEQSDGLFLEFGVFKGASINFMASRLKHVTFHGFDSFEGLQEDWSGHFARKGTFNLSGNLPKVEPNVSLIKGWFNNTLPAFLEEQESPITLLHVDCDTYESAYYVLDELGGRLRPGSLVIFDEHHGYPNWRKGEFHAWQQACEKFNIEFSYLGFSQYQALVIITNIGDSQTNQDDVGE